MMLINKKIGVDAGHGGIDPGAVDPHNWNEGDRLYTEEEDVNLNFSKILGAMLQEKGVRVVYTRTKDTTLSLTQRSDMLNAAGVDLVLSIHANAVASSAARGAELFVQAKGGKAERLAIYINNELHRLQIPTRGVKVKNLHMTRETKAPAILIELDFITNPSAEINLHNVRYLEKMAQAIVHGLERA